jgi:hypothetical protein
LFCTLQIILFILKTTTAVVNGAIIAAERLRRWLFVLGVSPDKAESEYG